ncbi:MAG: thiamine pyrophosphate-dependent enzyme [SAR324 cluster bacterium]|jgi:2-oxoglutarate ferredoxin oxidoreductase subunit beta|nr:2-oxoglutarate oxidoreductase [Deltaproteobacteria bacterium]MDP6091299.1 thiamine pyrophosphate-dependent enzyme [SAR324 cluster bacterium]MBP43110.1 2-oxoglutarate oxidoreductase [Deltaproteobacteria bacterium]MDP6247751.1 thiamine pyrophosphate-dependent enzyme [SAR324 cluster bacterium]MDP6330214.1 thiamine pyrophosphate-dependent enzyme [SAR324 cluster bacterium]|tara:strand:+ start:2755 stop:3708 length:954 start_codon:yes stop_codon:yes gene_type:complete
MFGLRPDCVLKVPEEYYTLEDYESNEPRWCPSCGDHAVLTAVQKVCREKQLAPEKTVFVSGIGCSSRFPHYMHTYGFHGLHGRAIPVACGIKFRRPDLNVIVVTGDGDCCSIGTSHWIHAIRYNMDITLLLLDNEIYGLTKNQTSPTSKQGAKTYTHPRGIGLKPLNPIMTTLGVTNVSFVAQTVDWSPQHLYSTALAAFEHPGFSFVRIMQRCPHFSPDMFKEEAANPDMALVMTHEDGITLPDEVKKIYRNTEEHDPSNINAAREMAGRMDEIPIGLFYRNPDLPRYDQMGSYNLGYTVKQKTEALEHEFDRYAV